MQSSKAFLFLKIFRWEGHAFTGHNSPMYARPESGELDPESPGYQFNTNFSVNYWLQLGAKRETVRMNYLMNASQGPTLKKFYVLMNWQNELERLSLRSLSSLV